MSAQIVRDGFLVLATVILVASFVGSMAMALTYRWRRQKAHTAAALFSAQDRRRR